MAFIDLLLVGLSVFTVLFSALAAIFSFLIWRSSITLSVQEQEQVLRERFQGMAYSINMPDDVDFEEYQISIQNPICTESSGKFYRVKRLIFGASGDTKAIIQFREISETGPGGQPLAYNFSKPSIRGEIRQHPWYENLEMGILQTVDESSVHVVFNTTNPERVNQIMSKFVQMVQQILWSKYSNKSIMVRDPDAEPGE